MSEAMLQVSRLNKRFGALQASDNLSFTVNRGEIHALIGPNGAGKTTAINQLTGELKPDSGAKIARSAGSAVEVVAHNDGNTNLKMPSSEIRRVKDTAWASVGEVSNDEHKLRNYGKAGRKRWLGIRPTVRGSAMNPVDHPYGGGEGRQGRGLRRAKSKWGKETGIGHRTRRAKKYSNVFIVTRRKVGKRR